VSERAHARYELPKQERGEDGELVSPSIRRRRAAAAAARRRRLALIDLGIGLLIALLVILLSGGLAMTALVLVLAMLALAARTGVRWLLRRRRARRVSPAPRRRPGSQG